MRERRRIGASYCGDARSSWCWAFALLVELKRERKEEGGE